MTSKPAMPAKTLKALKASIEHWKKNEAGNFDGVQSDDCALCALFYENYCSGCPVSRRTKRLGCAGTPYIHANNSLAKHGYASEQFRADAKLEREFLESLLPKEARK